MRQVKIDQSRNILTPDEVSRNSICLLICSTGIYHLNRITADSNNKYAFVDLGGGICWANGSYEHIKNLIEDALSLGDVYVFDSLKEMAQFIVEKS